MIIGVMSDTHGNRVVMHQVADYMKYMLKVELIYHLGDDYRDAQDLALAGHNVHMVPGLWCPEYESGHIPNFLIEQVDGLTLAAAHAEKDLRAQCRAAAIILVGHTHKPKIEHIGWSLYINPGHMRGDYHSGQRATYAVIEITPESVQTRIYNVLGQPVLESVVSREKLA